MRRLALTSFHGGQRWDDRSVKMKHGTVWVGAEESESQLILVRDAGMSCFLQLVSETRINAYIKNRFQHEWVYFNSPSYICGTKEAWPTRRRCNLSQEKVASSLLMLAAGLKPEWFDTFLVEHIRARTWNYSADVNFTFDMLSCTSSIQFFCASAELCYIGIHRNCPLIKMIACPSCEATKYAAPYRTNAAWQSADTFFTWYVYIDNYCFCMRSRIQT